MNMNMKNLRIVSFCFILMIILIVMEVLPLC